MIVLDDGVYIEDAHNINAYDEYVRFHDESGTPISINAKLIMKLYPTAKRIIYEDDDGRC